MADKLNWKYENAGENAGGEIALVPGTEYRIRAVRDSDACNPFTDGDMNWSIVTRCGGRHNLGFMSYFAGAVVDGIDCPIGRFSTALLLHWQTHIAKLFGSTVRDLLECHGNSEDELPEGKRMSKDPDALRDVFDNAWHDIASSEKLELAVELLKMVGIKAICGQTTGYSQGDWVEVLVIADPIDLLRFGRTETSEEIPDAELEFAIDLYGAWAWGDVYGYVVEKRKITDATCVRCANTDNDGSDVCPDCGDEMESEETWEEIEDGSCWGYYGSDHHKSGLEEAALECVCAR